MQVERSKEEVGECELMRDARCKRELLLGRWGGLTGFVRV